MKRVIVESPYKGDVDANVRYARRALADSLSRGEAPFASHLLYTQDGVLDDDIRRERLRGIQAGQAWGLEADLIAVYADHGISDGMWASINRYIRNDQTIILRWIDNDRPQELFETGIGNL